MSKKRPTIPRQTADRVMKEFRHKCAICGKDRPQLHHLDGDKTNNDPMNLLPLCPNCHLQDVHDPTGRPDPEKLKLFRRHKDPLILHPRFHPIFLRLRSLVRGIRLEWQNYQYYTADFLDFIGEFEMGTFYKKKITLRLQIPARFYIHHLFQLGQLQNREKPLTEPEVMMDPDSKAKMTDHCIEEIETLTVELLRY